MSEKFEFTPENLERAKGIIAKYPEGRQWSAVLALLDLGQRQNGGHCSDAVIDAVAALLRMPRIRVVENATFYTMINTRPVGRHVLQFCTTTPCWLCGSSAVVDAAKERLGVGMGETTADGLFTLMEVECVGACVNAPVVQINDDMYEDLSPAQFVEVLDALARGETPPHGSQTGRRGSAPKSGPKALKSLTFGDD